MASKFKKTFVSTIAENIDMRTPRPRVSAKPLISDVPNQKRISAVKIEEMFESRIENQARSKPVRTASAIVRPSFNSSFILSNTNTFASTAIPIEIMNPAIPAAVSVTGINLKSANIIKIKNDRDTTATMPGNLYQIIKKRAISKNPTTAAFTPAFTLPTDYSTESDVKVFVGGVYQEPNQNYEIDDVAGTITFGNAPGNGVRITHISGENSTQLS